MTPRSVITGQPLEDGQSWGWLALRFHEAGHNEIVAFNVGGGRDVDFATSALGQPPLVGRFFLCWPAVGSRIAAGM